MQDQNGETERLERVVKFNFHTLDAAFLDQLSGAENLLVERDELTGGSVRYQISTYKAELIVQNGEVTTRPQIVLKWGDLYLLQLGLDQTLIKIIPEIPFTGRAGELYLSRRKALTTWVEYIIEWIRERAGQVAPEISTGKEPDVTETKVTPPVNQSHPPGRPSNMGYDEAFRLLVDGMTDAEAIAYWKEKFSEDYSRLQQGKSSPMKVFMSAMNYRWRKLRV